MRKIIKWIKAQYHLLISSKPVKAFLSFWVWRICEKETHKPEPVQYGEAKKYISKPIIGSDDEWLWDGK